MLGLRASGDFGSEGIGGLTGWRHAGTTQHKHWIFTADKLAELRAESNRSAAAAVKRNAGASPDPCILPIHPGGNPEENLKSISHRCHPILVAFVGQLTKEAIELPLGCLQGGCILPKV